jgi:3-oxoacyl-[acyl-carrier-protein] synthase II
MTKKRIVVTGMGLVSCFGTDVEHFYQELLNGKSGIGMIESFPCAEYPTRFAGFVRNFDPGEYMDKKQARRTDPYIRYAIVAGKKALEMSKLTGDAFHSLDKTRCGIIIGSGMGGMEVLQDGVMTINTQGYKRLTPFFIPYIITNMAGALLAIDTGFMGPNYSISTACATATHSIHEAAEQILTGKADLMICGGSEAAVNPVGLSGFVAIRALSTRNDAPEEASRPWDTARDGFVMGEGAGVLVLESLEHALARGAPIYAEFLGSAINCDAHHMTDPRPDGSGVARCIEEALKTGGIAKTDVNYVNAHATATLAGDLCELKALRSVFGDHISKMKVNATKSMIGHALGAAGGLEAIATIQAIRKGKVHPTINLDNPEPAAEGFNLVPNVAQDLKVKVAISNSFGFGGHNGTLVFGPYHA